MADTPSLSDFSPVRMSASTPEAAISQALQIVGASRDEVEVEVIEQTEKRATVRVSPRRSASSPAEAPPQRGLEPAPIEDEADNEAFAAPETPSLFDADGMDDDINVDTVELVATSAAGVDAAADFDKADEETEVEDTIPSPPVRVIDEATREHARAVAQDFLDRMGLEAQASVVDGPFSVLEAEDAETTARLHIKIDGPDVGILIGKHGQTLQSFQYLLNLTLNNRGAEAQNDGASRDASSRDDALRVVVDAGGYRSRRAQVLEQSAQEAATRAKRDRRSIRMEPMPAYERRLIHMALRDDTTITTGSEGREPLRHVVISPIGVRPTPLTERSGGYGNRPNRGGYGGNRGGRGGSGSSSGNRGGFARD